MEGRRSIVFLNRFYWPDVAATGQMLADLAEGMAEMGWDVTVVSSRTRYEGAQHALPRTEFRRGVRIIRVTTTRFGRSRVRARLGDYATYLVGAFLTLFRIPAPDVVVAMTDPPLLLAPVLAAGRFRGFRTVLWLQDLYPQLAAKLEVLREDGLVYRLLRAVSARLYRGCDRIVALGPRMREEVIAAGAEPGRTTYVHNWSDENAVFPITPASNPFVREHALEGLFVVLYSGNTGRAHIFEAVLEAARRLRDDPKVVFLFIGGGVRLSEIRAAAAEEGGGNIRILDYVPRDELALSLSAASCTLVTESPDVLGLLVPSKTYGVLASGRPLLFVGSPDSDVATIVREWECGMIIAPDDPGGLVGAINQLRGCSALCDRLGRRARQAAEEQYSKEAAIREWAELAERLVAGRAPRAHDGGRPLR